MVSITIKYAADESRYGGYHLYKAAGKLAGKKALISGADPGIGRAIAILYAMEGAESTIIYVPEEEADAQETQKLVQERGGRAHLIQADLTNEQTCKDVVDKAIGYMGRINILVLNHGPEVMKETIEEVTENGWITTYNSNIQPFSLLSEYTTPQMIPGDTIITCAPDYPYVGHPELLDYTCSKGATVALMRDLSSQHIAMGIRVNAVCPGRIWTPLVLARMSKEAQEKFTTPIGRPGQPIEVATCFVFLAGPDSSFISGQCLYPNGGVVNGNQML